MIAALVLLLCPDLVSVGSPFSVVLAASSSAEVGAYYAEMALPVGFVVEAVDPVSPFLAVWFVGEDQVLRMAGWQVANPGTVGDVPIVRVSMTAEIQGTVRLMPASPQIFAVSGDEADSTVQGCKVRVGS